MSLFKNIRRGAGDVKRWLAPTPEMTAWRHACRMSERTPRRTPGRIQMGPYTLRYSDLLTFCPQWQDIFVMRSLAFTATSAAPRILDCGANVGLASLFFKRDYPQARITAFEADPAIAAMLVDNLRTNGAGDVEVVAAAVWAADGEIEFTADGADAGAITAVAGGPAGRSMRVPTVRLADLLARGPVDLLKLDIEGAETDVLTDCEPLLGNVKALLLEVHEFIPSRRRSPALLDLLERSGFAYAVSHVTPLPGRQDGPTGPFPGRAQAWVEAVSAWRPSSP
jgi:FkbM family methyltransferase